MDISSSVNDQITDSVSQMNTLLLASSAPQSLGIVDVAGAEALSLFMYNAVTAQQNAQISSAAATTSVCAKILQAQMPVPPTPEAPKAPPPPPFMPLGPGVSEKDLLVNLQQLIETLQSMERNVTPAPATSAGVTAPVNTSPTTGAPAQSTTVSVTPAGLNTDKIEPSTTSGGTSDTEKK